VAGNGIRIGVVSQESHLRTRARYHCVFC